MKLCLPMLAALAHLLHLQSRRLHLRLRQLQQRPPPSCQGGPRQPRLQNGARPRNT